MDVVVHTCAPRAEGWLSWMSARGRRWARASSMSPYIKKKKKHSKFEESPYRFTQYLEHFTIYQQFTRFHSLHTFFPTFIIIFGSLIASTIIGQILLRVCNLLYIWDWISRPPPQRAPPEYPSGWQANRPILLLHTDHWLQARRKEGRKLPSQLTKVLSERQSSPEYFEKSAAKSPRIFFLLWKLRFFKW